MVDFFNCRLPPPPMGRLIESNNFLVLIRVKASFVFRYLAVAGLNINPVNTVATGSSANLEELYMPVAPKELIK